MKKLILGCFLFITACGSSKQSAGSIATGFVCIKNLTVDGHSIVLEFDAWTSGSVTYVSCATRLDSNNNDDMLAISQVLDSTANLSCSVSIYIPNSTNRDIFSFTKVGDTKTVSNTTESGLLTPGTADTTFAAADCTTL